MAIASSSRWFGAALVPACTKKRLERVTGIETAWPARKFGGGAAELRGTTSVQVSAGTRYRE